MIIKIAERIRELRDKNYLTQAELARKMGVTRSSVNAWEMSISIPSTEKIVELCEILHTSADYLLGIQNKEYIIVDDYQENEKELLYRMASYFDDVKEQRDKK